MIVQAAASKIRAPNILQTDSSSSAGRHVGSHMIVSRKKF